MTDVPRWTAEGAGVPDDVREVFASAKSDGPGAGQTDALWAKLAPLVGPMDGGPDGGPDGSAGNPDGGLDPSGGPAVGALGRGLDPASTATASTAAGGSAATWLRPLLTAVVAATAIGTSAIWVGETRPAVEAPSRQPRTTHVTSRPPGNAAEHVIAPPSASVLAEPVPKPSPRRNRPRDAAVEVPVEPEALFLQRAHTALRSGDAAKALAMANEHRRLYPKPALAQEREIIVVQALVDLGRRDEAIARSRSFLEQYPKSAHARRLRTILGLPEPLDPTSEKKTASDVIIPDAGDHSQPERVGTGATTP